MGRPPGCCRPVRQHHTAGGEVGMRSVKKRGPGPSSLLMTPDHAGNVVGIDPHKRTLSATVADARGGILGSAHFRVSGVGHRELEAWARQFGQIARWGVEGAASWGRHTAMFLAGRGHDVRDVCANRTPRSDRARQRGKSDSSTASGSPARRWRTRCCPRRSSARALTAAWTSSISCWPCGTTSVGRS